MGSCVWPVLPEDTLHKSSLNTWESSNHQTSITCKTYKYRPADNASSAISDLNNSTANLRSTSEALSQESVYVSFFKFPCTKVTSQLFIGSFEDVMNEDNLRGHGITHIISLIGPQHMIKGMRHGHCPMNDYGRSDLNGVIKQLCPIIEESQQPDQALFIHCMSGQNRSATLMLAILMKIKGKKLYEAYKLLKNMRPLVQINRGYAKQLIDMELELFGSISVSDNWMEIASCDTTKGVTFIGESVSTLSSKNNTGKSPILKPTAVTLRLGTRRKPRSEII